MSTRSMLYPACARQVTQADIEAAARVALASAQDPARLNAFLADWPSWHRLQRAEVAETLTCDLILAEDASTMTPTQREDLADSCCPILLCPPSADDRVFIHSGETLQVFSLQALLQHWVEYGTNPVNRQPLGLEQLRRVS